MKIIFVNGDNERGVRLVASMATTQLAKMKPEDRAQLMAGLKALLPHEEFEQCEILEGAITEKENANRRAEEAQLLLGEMLDRK